VATVTLASGRWSLVSSSPRCWSQIGAVARQVRLRGRIEWGLVMTIPTMTPAGWYSDPSGRHEYRYWNGKDWSPQVSDGGHPSTDQEVGPPASSTGAFHPLATPEPTLTPPAWPQPAAPQSKRATPSPPLQPEPDAGLSREQLMSKPTPAPAAARAGRSRWVVPMIAGIAVLAVIAGLLIWAPWVSKVPTTPAAVRAQSLTSTSVLVQWAQPTTGASVDSYLIRRDGVQVGSVLGRVTSYQDKGLAPATAYRYSVVAVSGTVRSVPSPALVVKTLTPPLSSARLEGLWTVDAKVIKSNYIDIDGKSNMGHAETDSWQFVPTCAVGACDVVVSGDWYGTPFKATLTHAGAVYMGTTKASITSCGPSSIPVQDTLTIQMTVKNAGASDQIWSASSWVGTLEDYSPAIGVGADSCSAASFTASVSSTGTL